MTNYYTKELNTDNQKKSFKFAEEVQKIKTDAAQLTAQKEKANQRIPEIKTELSQLVTDVDVITNDSKRKKVLKDKAILQEELNELELYSVMDIERYKQKRLKGLYSLGEQAQQEYRAYDEQATELLRVARAELQEKEQEIISAKNRFHPFIKYEATFNSLLQEERREQAIKEKENKNKKTIHVDSAGNEVIGTFNWKK
ncbi:hypothetical protein [Marinilactibacillus sp. Marseille-P9653]|uniref:hypothetical protein n=1 Tax=Marinilactibacillus sp. Marseille-P9653 TaxID=2866583 RepID=UPI001CE4605C|nr:hypothetical protein [Marinilactibacillus sp. Marseille-P9653]